MYASPRSDFDVSAPPEYTEADYQRETAHPYWQQRATKEAIQVRDYGNTFDFLEGKFSRPGKLLDIGSGYGELIREFNRRGWETVGIDPHPGFYRWTKERGLNVINGFFESSGFAESEFDVVTMNHVIEHVLDPLHLLKGIHHVLKPNGYAIVETPRYDSVPFKLLGRRERSLSCNGHIYFFTGPTLTKLAELAGFSVTRLDSVGRSMTLDRLLWNVGVMSKNHGVRTAVDRFSRAAKLDRIKLKLSMGDMQRAYLQKGPASESQ